MSSNLKILLVEDEDAIRKFTRVNLEREGYDILEAETGEKGIELARSQHPDILILDIMLPGIDGFEVCEILRKEFPYLGIIMLTAKTQDIDKIMGLEHGCDDYMIKPFNPRELVLRVKSLARRLEPSSLEHEGVFEIYPFKLDKYSKKFYKYDKKIDITPTEFTIIDIFMENPGKAFSRDDILNLVWGVDFVGDSKIVDVNIRRLRSKLEDDPSNPKYIETIWGVGYRWTLS